MFLTSIEAASTAERTFSKRPPQISMVISKWTQLHNRRVWKDSNNTFEEILEVEADATLEQTVLKRSPIFKLRLGASMGLGKRFERKKVRINRKSNLFPLEPFSLYLFSQILHLAIYCVWKPPSHPCVTVCRVSPIITS